MTTVAARREEQPTLPGVPDPPKPKHLAAKLAEVMAAIGFVEKRGVNEFHRYRYATEMDVAAAVRKELSSRSIIMVPTLLDCVEREVKTQKGGTEYITRVSMEYTLIDGETDERISFVMPGCGQDRGDKGIFKAVTGSEKYALMKLFLIPTGDDPEGDADVDRRNAAPVARDRKPAAKEPPTDPMTGQPTISEEQAADLETLLKDAGKTEAWLMKKLGYGYRLEHVRIGDYARVVEGIARAMEAKK